MFKKIFLAGALLLPALAYGASPKADFSVQIPGASTTPPPPPPSTGPTPPSEAQLAGFTTLAGNYDFSQSQYATLSNWLDCSGTDTSKVWHFVHTAFPCNSSVIFQTNDNGNTVLDIRWQQSFQSYGQSGNSNFVELDTATTDGSGNINTANYPLNAYYETVWRDTTWGTGGGAGNGPDAIWTWSNVPGGGLFEVDINEIYGGPSGTAGVANWGASSSGGGACTFDTGNYLCNSPNQPSGLNESNYTKAGMLITGNGSTGSGKEYACTFINDVFQNCADLAPNTIALTERQWLKMWTGGTNPVPPSTDHKDMYVQYVRVWTCGTPSGSCNSSTLSQTPEPNSTTLSYYH